MFALCIKAGVAVLLCRVNALSHIVADLNKSLDMASDGTSPHDTAADIANAAADRLEAEMRMREASRASATNFSGSQLDPMSPQPDLRAHEMYSHRPTAQLEGEGSQIPRRPRQSTQTSMGGLDLATLVSSYDGPVLAEKEIHVEPVVLDSASAAPTVVLEDAEAVPALALPPPVAALTAQEVDTFIPLPVVAAASIMLAPRPPLPPSRCIPEEGEQPPAKSGRSFTAASRRVTLNSEPSELSLAGGIRGPAVRPVSISGVSSRPSQGGSSRGSRGTSVDDYGMAYGGNPLDNRQDNPMAPFEEVRFVLDLSDYLP